MEGSAQAQSKAESPTALGIALHPFLPCRRREDWGLSDPTAPEYSWYQVFSAGKVPGNFPLTHGRFLAGSDQLILADRPRW